MAVRVKMLAFTERFWWNTRESRISILHPKASTLKWKSSDPSKSFSIFAWICFDYMEQIKLKL